MEYTLEKTKKIRKIHEKTNRAKSVDIEKLKEISKLRPKLNDAKVK
jgi:hypothetical protein